MRAIAQVVIPLSMILLSSIMLPGQSGQPRIFFSDLDSGPKYGGQDNKGVFVTIWGKGFGASKGESRVTVGGQAADNYPVWSDGRITFQLGANVRTGDIVVNVPGRTNPASNGIPFTVRSGRIFFVSTLGDDNRSGSYALPWRTIVHAKNSMSAGDTAYIEDGVVQAREDNFGAYLSMDRKGSDNSGAPRAPKALVAYPGATVTIGAARGLHFGVRTPNIDTREDYWVISQLHIISSVQAMDLSGVGWKIVGNDMQCPGADGQVGCFEMSESSQIRFYGNAVHNAGAGSRTSKFYHAVYFSTDSNHIDVGWNHIHDNATCRAIQFHSSPLCSPDCGGKDTTGFNQYDLHVHDNLIHGDNCNGINFATVDPSRGAVEAYNNVIYHVGLQDPSDQGGAFSCIYVAGITNNGKPGRGMVEVFNNTVYDCAANNSRNAQGSRGAFSVGADEGLVMRLRNNIVYQLRGEIYIDGNTALITGERNLWFGAGNGPSQTSNNLGGDPAFLNRNAADFHLVTGSPARGAGVAALPDNSFVEHGSRQATDQDGAPRPQGGGFGFTLGAYEIPAARTAGVKAAGP
ncbi:MAG TPA: IPT/TIG domain-containing protein [Candidatus Angelobacter sp.]